MIYYRTIQVEFNHCDPAGIVFYPRYFEMTNSVVEIFFREVVRHSYADMMTHVPLGPYDDAAAASIHQAVWVRCWTGDCQ